MRIGYEYAPSIGKFFGKQTVDADARYYLRLGETVSWRCEAAAT